MHPITTLPTFPARKPDAHKGDFGRVLVIAGSAGMSGAAVLAGRATLRGGAGLVRIAVPATIQPIVAMGDPCYTTVGLPTDADGRFAASAIPALRKQCEANDVVALGPGLGQSDDLRTLVADISDNCNKPMVIDADGLNALIGQTERLMKAAGPRVITPHPGEFARLTGVDSSTVQSQRQTLAIDFARRMRCVVVLKGHGTIVTDGERVYQNTTGNPGMATGGTGDVLTGLIAALLGQQIDPFDAAQLGVYIHGQAGDMARDQVGETSLVATDLVDFLPAAFQGVRSQGSDAGVRDQTRKSIVGDCDRT